MICKKDVESGKAFWVAAIASRVILPNGKEAERKTYDGISSARMTSTGSTSSRTSITSITPWVLEWSHIP